MSKITKEASHSLHKSLKYCLRSSKRLLMAVLFTVACLQQAWAYDFSATAPSGQTLYFEFNYDDNGVRVVAPDYDYYGYTRPTGDLVIPSTVNSYGITYSVTSIGSYAFEGCTGLTSVTIPNSVTEIGGWAFEGCTGLTSVTIPNSVTSIGSSAFKDCTGLTSVTIPNSVISIGESAFRNTGLISVTIPNATTEYSAFADCPNLTSVTIGDSVTTIGDCVFEDCIGLTSVTIGNNVTSIGTYAFHGCTSLISVTIPNSVTSIGYSPFGGVVNIVYHGTAINEHNDNWGAMYRNKYYENGFLYEDSTKTTLFKYFGTDTNVIIPNSVTTIGNSAFYNCTGLTSVTLPNNVTTIGNSAFYNCTGLTSVTLPNSVDTIGHYAFFNTGLTSITIPENVKYVGSIAFGNYESEIPSSLTTVVWNAKDATIGTDNYGDAYSPFYGCSNISTVTFGDSVRVIPGKLFPSVSENITPNVYYGRDIESWINIERPSTYIYDYNYHRMFREVYHYNLYINNQLVTNLVVPNTVDTIQAGTFYGCSSIQSITIPEQIEFIGYNTFCCINLNSMTWNDINCNVGGRIFGECGFDNINSLVFGDSVQVIPDYAFQFFPITNVNLPASLTAIGASAFGACTNLTSITIPAQVTSIGEYAFGECGNLRSITMEATVPPTIYTNTFDEVGTGVRVDVPCGTVEDYSTAPFWFNFSNIQQSSECVRTITVMSLNASQGSVLGGGTYEYGSTATIAAIPNTGYQFYQWSDGNTNNPRSLVVSSDSSFIAMFSAISTGGVTHDTVFVDRYIYDTITNTVHDTTVITQIDTVVNTVHDTIINTVHDTIINTVHDTIINTVHDTVINTVHDTIINTVHDTIINTVHDTIINTVHDTITIIQYDTIINTVYDTITVSETYYTLDVTSTNSAYGIGAGSGSYPEGCVVTLVGLPMEGYRFVSWNDGNTDNPRQITITDNASYVANFSTVGIEEAPEVQNLTVYPNPTNGVVTVSEYDVNKVEIYDAVGKKVREYISQRVLDMSDLSSGEYMLRITLPQGVAVRKVIRN